MAEPKRIWPYSGIAPICFFAVGFLGSCSSTAERDDLSAEVGQLSGRQYLHRSLGFSFSFPASMPLPSGRGAHFEFYNTPKGSEPDGSLELTAEAKSGAGQTLQVFVRKPGFPLSEKYFHQSARSMARALSAGGNPELRKVRFSDLDFYTFRLPVSDSRGDAIGELHYYSARVQDCALIVVFISFGEGPVDNRALELIKSIRWQAPPRP